MSTIVKLALASWWRNIWTGELRLIAVDEKGQEHVIAAAAPGASHDAMEAIHVEALSKYATPP